MFENFGKKKSFGSLGFFACCLPAVLGALDFFHVACLVRFAMHDTRDVIGMCAPSRLERSGIHPSRYIAPV